MVAPANGPEVDADLREQLVEEHNHYNEGDEGYEERKKELGDSSVNESLDKEAKDRVSHHDEIKHPNMELSDGLGSEMGVDQGGNPIIRKRGCGFYFKKLDYEILRPLLIFRYEREEMHRQDDFIEMMMSDGNLLGSIYGKLD